VPYELRTGDRVRVTPGSRVRGYAPGATGRVAFVGRREGRGGPVAL
jgi:hypothetical protein